MYIYIYIIGSVSENGVCLTIPTSDNQQYLHLIVGCVWKLRLPPNSNDCEETDYIYMYINNSIGIGSILFWDKPIVCPHSLCIPQKWLEWNHSISQCFWFNHRLNITIVKKISQNKSLGKRGEPGGPSSECVQNSIRMLSQNVLWTRSEAFKIVIAKKTYDNMQEKPWLPSGKLI